MALRGIQEYIARDANYIARVEDEGNIVSIEGNIFLSRKRDIQYYYYYSYRALCVILLKRKKTSTQHENVKVFNVLYNCCN